LYHKRSYTLFLATGVSIFLDLKNVSNDEEAHMSDVLQQLFEEVMNQDNDFKSSIPLNSYGRLRAAVNKTFQLFLSKGWRIISAVHECIQLHITCSNFKSLAALFREHINGQINTNLSDLNEALTELVSGGKPCFQTIIYRDEFWNVLDKSSKKLCSLMTI
jgi:phage-related protein